jgi:hypothetical protein
VGEIESIQAVWLGEQITPGVDTQLEKPRCFAML